MIGLMTVSTFCAVDIPVALGGYPRRYEGLFKWFTYIFLFMCSCYYIDKKRCRQLINSFLAGGLISGIYGIMQYFMLDFLPRHPNFAGRSLAFSFFDNPNFFGTYLVMLTVIGFAYYLTLEHRVYVGTLYAVNLVLFAAILYSKTRGAWIGMVAGMLVFFVSLKVKISWKRYLAMLAGYACIFIVISSREIGLIERILSITSDYKRALAGDTTAGASRWYIWTLSLPLVKDYFWLGSGLDTFGLVFPGKFFHNAHNIYLQLAITAGVPAMLAYVTGTSSVLGKMFVARRRVKDPNEHIVLCGIMAACTGYMVQTFFNVSVIAVAPFFWVLLGLGYRLSLDRSTDNPIIPHSNSRGTLAEPMG